MNFWLRWLGLWLVLGLAVRIAFLQWYPEQAAAPSFVHFFYGSVNDLQAFILAAGVVALFSIFSLRSFRVAAFVVLVISMVILIAESFFWMEFESRLDRLVFHYLAYPKEVLTFLDEQFYLSILVVPFLGLCWLVMQILGWPTTDDQRPAVASVLMAGALGVALVGQPLGQSNFRIVSEFTSNGYLGVLTSARYAVDDVAWLDVDVEPFKAQPVSYLPAVAADMNTQTMASIRHVVLIIEESFAGPVWQQKDLRAKYLPNFSALAKESLSFSNVFATGSRTTRGLEALLNGFPPLPGISTTQRDGFERLPSLARGLADGGFYPAFLYGGWPGFSNFSNYWQAAGFREIWTREDFNEPFETSWGVADEALLERLVLQMNELTEAHERVFLSTLTVSHHRPYDFPKGAIDWPADERRSDYAMAYADHALGRFFDAAKRTPWYANTLFIVVADHGLHPRGDALIPAESYRIPLLMHAAGIAPRELTGLGSAMSLAKTLMELFEIESTEAFAGYNLLCDCDTAIPMEFGYHVGLLERGSMQVIRADGQAVSWSYDAATNRLQNPVEQSNPQMQQRVLEFFAPSYRWFYGKTAQ